MTFPILPCSHRGARIGTHKCQTCGPKGRSIIVYQCALYAECTLVPWRMGQGEMICENCPDITTTLPETPDPPPPALEV